MARLELPPEVKAASALGVSSRQFDLSATRYGTLAEFTPAHVEGHKS